LGDFLADPEATVSAARPVEAKRRGEILLDDYFGLLWHGCHMPLTSSDGSSGCLGGGLGLYQAASYPKFEKRRPMLATLN
jgi:hypothetical protein